MKSGERTDKANGHIQDRPRFLTGSKVSPPTHPKTNNLRYVGTLSVRYRSTPTRPPWVAPGSPATQEFYALVRNYGVKRMVRLKVESLYTVLDYPYSTTSTRTSTGNKSSSHSRPSPAPALRTFFYKVWESRNVLNTK